MSLVCRACAHVHIIPADDLDATFGPSFDLVARQRQIARQLHFLACGETWAGVDLPREDAGRYVQPSVAWGRPRGH